MVRSASQKPLNKGPTPQLDVRPVSDHNSWAGLALGVALLGGLGNLLLPPDRVEAREPDQSRPATDQELTPGRAPRIGQKIPDITVRDRNNKEIRLSQALGDRVMLVDFWASWCGPCRVENPHVVAAYTKYKNSDFVDRDGHPLGSGFEVFSISVDTERRQWLAAIKTDRLTWQGHGLDEGWGQIKTIYGIETIPSNFLVGADGTILAKNLRGAALAQFLEKLRDKNATGTPRRAPE